MKLMKAKIYNDGSHYIAIPQEPQPWKKRKNVNVNKTNEINEQVEKVFKDNKELSKKEKTKIAVEQIKQIVKNEEKAKEIVKANCERIKRNSIVRMIRFVRKAYLQEWHYFCTFTYDSNKLTEEDFKKKFSFCIRHLANRKQWKYIGVWELSPVNNRLHFHGLFYTPIMVGTLIETKDFSTKTHKMQAAIQNTFFLERFGRNDFKKLDKNLLPQTLIYLLKYIRKTNDKIVYSRNIATYLLTDINEEDIVCPIGIEDRKRLLFDNFKCYDAETGEYFGEISEETKAKLNKCN